MKVVVFPGVGDNRVRSAHKYFLDKITKGLNCEGEIFVWENGHGHPTIDLPLHDARKFVCEVILDFQQVVVHSLDMKVPEADVYIGHSAGSILALSQNKPCVTFASPASLVELINDKDTVANKCRYAINKNSNKVLNIINKYDVIAYPIEGDNVENYEYNGSWYSPLSYFPVTTHIHYWKSKEVIKKIIDTLKSW